MTSLALGDASANHDLSVTLYTLSFTHTVVKHPACIAKSTEDQCNAHAVADHTFRVTFVNVLSCKQEGLALVKSLCEAFVPSEAKFPDLAPLISRLGLQAQLDFKAGRHAVQGLAIDVENFGSTFSIAASSV